MAKKQPAGPFAQLPLAVELAKAGFRTTGIDLDPRKLEALNVKFKS